MTAQTERKPIDHHLEKVYGATTSEALSAAYLGWAKDYDTETILGVIDPEMMVPATGRTDLDVFAKVYEKNYKLHLIQYELN